MPVHANSNLSSLLHSSLYSQEILDFYRSRSDWFNARRLRRLVFHTSKENDHLVLPDAEVCRYASRLLSMQEAFLLWFEKLPQSHKNLLVLLVKNPVLSVDRAYRMAGILDGNFSDSDFESFAKTEILGDIQKKQKYILENIAIYKNGFVFCPAVFRRYIATHLSALDKYKNLSDISVCAEGDFFPVPAGEILKESPALFQKTDNIIEEKLKSAATIREAIEIIADAPNSFDAAFLVPHLNLNARYWFSPKTTQEKIRQIDSLSRFLESPLFENPVSFEKIEDSFYKNITSKVPKFYIPAAGNGYFVRLESEKASKMASSAKSAKTSACFGKRLELSGGDFLYNFVSIPAFNNLLLMLCRLGFFECTLSSGMQSPFHNAMLYPLGKIKAVRRKC